MKRPQSEKISEEKVWQLATRLLGHAPKVIKPLKGQGWNNQLFQVVGEDGPVALKCYPKDDRRGRMARELSALLFLEAHPPLYTPKLLASDPVNRVLMMEWVEGAPITKEEAGNDAVDAMLSFMQHLHGLRGARGADNLVAASDAVFDVTSAHHQIQRRLSALEPAREKNPELDAFLIDLEEIHHTVIQRAQQQLGAMGPLPVALHTLSLSDFGFHNALRCSDGRIVFMDLEYFGWDDPVKLASDTLWHPAMALRGDLRARYCEKAVGLFAGQGDSQIRQRFSVMHPIFGLIWSLILLNVYVTDGQAAPQTHADGAALKRQLQMAKRYAATLQTGCHLEYHPALDPEEVAA
uniref:Putative aminoglycoside phosphotransferase n=1 Tax=Magnetococcus massalia (strain MO-1) TaxID=451514 RepID=A0A1S7LGG3_MAGMO|nr:Putative aminoglycoside phosphotransferase [Candidatus Magnetococcus massalia]